MGLVSRVSPAGPAVEEAEDFFATSLGVIFPGDVANLHGDADHGLLYTSPHLPKPLHLRLGDVRSEEDRQLFSHYLWNSSLLLAELVEAATLGLGEGAASTASNGDCSSIGTRDFAVTGLSTIELGAGTALPSLMAALLGASRVVATDYPAPVVLETLHDNVRRNVQPSFSPFGTAASIAVEGHEWGELTTPLAAGNAHVFDRVLVCDCLWMPWQHANLQRSIAWFLRESSEARCWIVSAFHTGRDKLGAFFASAGLAEQADLEVEHIWERDCNGEERPWAWDRGTEDVSARKRWLAVAVLRRRRRGQAGGVGRQQQQQQQAS